MGWGMTCGTSAPTSIDHVPRICDKMPMHDGIVYRDPGHDATPDLGRSGRRSASSRFLELPTRREFSLLGTTTRMPALLHDNASYFTTSRYFNFISFQSSTPYSPLLSSHHSSPSPTHARNCINHGRLASHIGTYHSRHIPGEPLYSTDSPPFTTGDLDISYVSARRD